MYWLDLRHKRKRFPCKHFKVFLQICQQLQQQAIRTFQVRRGQHVPDRSYLRWHVGLCCAPRAIFGTRLGLTLHFLIMYDVLLIVHGVFVVAYTRTTSLSHCSMDSMRLRYTTFNASLASRRDRSRSVFYTFRLCSCFKHVRCVFGIRVSFKLRTLVGPPYVIWENVVGLKGGNLDACLQQLRDAGYVGRVFQLNALDVVTPQSRPRLWGVFIKQSFADSYNVEMYIIFAMLHDSANINYTITYISYII